MGVLNTLIIRALRVSEKEHLHNVFLSNGYSPTQISKALTITKAHENKPNDSFKYKKVGDHKVFLPYIQGITKKISKHIKKKKH